ncbi:excinuclease ABC subunit UvrA [Chengkuizengella sp. SCS-71B]|uniref:excinuclease ABC subunit UvrA n=1 Tax=Chengkuizengella sp. SCS-71B TaxID=3115290 RepID=UPI0032C2293F
MKDISIKGARVHNLKGIDVSIPKNKLIVATGVSGSGKSSLVFDIIFEEGRRQYLQSLGILSEIDKEDKFDSITGIGPTVAVQQNIIRQSNSRSTVGSKTNILNLLGLLYAGEGQISCFSCSTPVDDNLTCKTCGNIEERLQAKYFSYNDQNGMCIKCKGHGITFEINMEKLIPNKNTTLEQVYDAVGLTPGYRKLLFKKFKYYLKMPFIQIPVEVQTEILYGHHVDSNNEKRSYCLSRLFKGRLYRNGEDLNGIYEMSVCTECHGFRIGEESQRVLLNGKHIGKLGVMTINELRQFLDELSKQETLSTFGKNILEDILLKTNHLIKYQLGHLSLYREMPTLSGGEIQRLFLNSHLETKMDSLIYILDEPTAGLHESEKSELLKSIHELKELGNTVIVVEHDINIIKMAEHIIDIGPKAGVEGGQVIYQGDLEGLLQCKDSITGMYLSVENFASNRSIKHSLENEPTHYITIRNAKTNNLKNVTVSIPLGGIIGVAGVSGSGKSSLISDTLIPLLKNYFRDQGNSSKNDIEESNINGDHEIVMVKTVAERLEGMQHISGYTEVSQAPIGRNMNSNSVTYIGIWDKIRKLFANKIEAVQQQLSAGHFSFNSKGACIECGGSGVETIWLGGNLTTEVTCRECQGKRYNNDALSVKYNDKNIFEVLEMNVSEAITFFQEEAVITAKLKLLDRIGMGYIKLGQPTPTFSGGEAQRIKLAKEIGKRRKGNILYVLDEPTTGLSLHDTAKLIQLLDELVEKGNSVIVIEHDPVVLHSCDWIVELGPHGGANGGEIIAEGSPQTLKNNLNSVTGRYL